MAWLMLEFIIAVENLIPFWPLIAKRWLTVCSSWKHLGRILPSFPLTLMWVISSPTERSTLAHHLQAVCSLLFVTTSIISFLIDFSPLTKEKKNQVRKLIFFSHYTNRKSTADLKIRRSQQGFVCVCATLLSGVGKF